MTKVPYPACGDQLPLAGLAIDRNEAATLQEFKVARAAGRPWGRKRIVSMHGLEAAGYVRRITTDAHTDDWELTPAGEAWQPKPTIW